MSRQRITLGLVPARGGSKGVPGKNLRLVRGRPLVAWAVECGVRAPSIDRVVVSTDSDQIAKAAQEAGADVPFMRPASLARDDTPMMPVMQHAVASVEDIYARIVDRLVLIDPTAPLRRVEDIEKAIRMHEEGDCDAVISGNVAHRNPYFNMVRQEGKYIRLVLEEGRDVGRRQDAPPVYDLNTVVWVYSRNAVMVNAERIPQRSRLYLVPRERAVDLDTEEDFERLSWMMERYEKGRLSEDS
ncbi:MAG: acylneuraminate cytidylyltransferase family protein [Deltaproteobacteria bacterium]|nr:acylneuraminate cytidylyltransferase family protein [Deltaproteobacteria bacterium]